MADLSIGRLTSECRVSFGKKTLGPNQNVCHLRVNFRSARYSGAIPMSSRRDGGRDCALTSVNDARLPELRGARCSLSIRDKPTRIGKSWIASARLTRC